MHRRLLGTQPHVPHIGVRDTQALAQDQDDDRHYARCFADWGGGFRVCVQGQGGCRAGFRYDLEGVAESGEMVEAPHKMGASTLKTAFSPECRRQRTRNGTRYST